MSEPIRALGVALPYVVDLGKSRLARSNESLQAPITACLFENGTVTLTARELHHAVSGGYTTHSVEVFADDLDAAERSMRVALLSSPVVREAVRKLSGGTW